ncbi:hypothetical protein C8J56DRAFT_918915 [Mycena floridula]|nr:hypothetical protein C8J56DRAFT_918915 [Mycena floridula]
MLTVVSSGPASSTPVSSTVKLSSPLFQSISGSTSVASSQSASVGTSPRASVSTTTFQSTKPAPQGPGLPSMPLSATSTRTSLSEVSRVNLATGQVSTSDTGAIAHASSSTATPSKTAIDGISSTAILSTSSRGPESVSKADSIRTSARASTTVVVIHGSQTPTPTLTETLTDQPESTFTSPVGITLVDHGKTEVSIPPLITVLSTATDGDGSFVTFTHIIANPTGLSGIKDDSSSLLQNAGKTAGVFLVVGLAAAFLIFCLFWLCRRRSRKNHQRRWLAHMQRPISPETVDPFQDPRTAVPETALFNSAGIHPWDFAQDQKPSQVNYGTATMGLGLTGINDSPNDRYSRNDTRAIGLAITTRSDPGKSQMSLAQSSPSLYPPTLPAEYPDDIFEEMDLQEEPRKVPPPRPPRSHLRDSVKASAGYPLTPPSSESSHTAVSNPPSPLEFRPQPFAEGRRTLLDVRPRASHDDMMTVRL